jgi:hypothetical protein
MNIITIIIITTTIIIIDNFIIIIIIIIIIFRGDFCQCCPEPRLRFTFKLHGINLTLPYLLKSDLDENGGILFSSF